MVNRGINYCLLDLQAHERHHFVVVVSQLVLAEQPLRRVGFDSIELHRADMHIACRHGVAHDVVSVCTGRCQTLYLLQAVLEERRTVAARTELHWVTKFLVLRHQVLGLAGIHTLADLGVFREQPVTHFDQLGKANRFRLRHRLEKLIPVLPDEPSCVRTLVDAVLRVAAGSDANKPHPVRPLMTAEIVRETLGAFVAEVAQPSGRDEVCDCIPFLDRAVTALPVRVGTVYRTLKLEQVRIGILRPVTLMLRVAPRQKTLVVSRRELVLVVRRQASLDAMPPACSFKVHVEVGLCIRTETRLHQRISDRLGKLQHLDERVLVPAVVALEVDDTDFAVFPRLEIEELLRRDAATAAIAVLVAVVPAIGLHGPVEGSHRADAVRNDQDAIASFGEAEVFRRAGGIPAVPDVVVHVGVHPCCNDVRHGCDVPFRTGELGSLLPGSGQPIVVEKGHRQRLA